MSRDLKPAAAPPESDSGENAIRTPRAGVGRRSEDIKLIELLKNQTARRIVSVGITAVVGISGYAIGYADALGRENNALKAQVLQLMGEKLTDDMKQDIVELKSASAAHDRSYADIYRKLDAIYLEVKKGNTP